MQIFSYFQQIFRWLVVTIFLALGVGCAALMNTDLMEERYLACPMDPVWNSSLQILQDYPMTVKDKTKGIIKTGWRVTDVEGPKYGLFRREGMSNKERSQLSVTLTPIGSDVIRLQLAERRQHWGFRGGAKIYDWYPIEPSQQEIDFILNNLTKKLEAEGCFIES